MTSRARIYLAALAVLGLAVGGAAASNPDVAHANPAAIQPASAPASEAPQSCPATSAPIAPPAAEALGREPTEAKICKPPLHCQVWGDPPRDHVCLVCV